jgi:hypothetical protein
MANSVESIVYIGLDAVIQEHQATSQCILFHCALVFPTIGPSQLGIFGRMAVQYTSLVELFCIPMLGLWSRHKKFRQFRRYPHALLFIGPPILHRIQEGRIEY